MANIIVMLSLADVVQRHYSKVVFGLQHYSNVVGQCCRPMLLAKDNIITLMLSANDNIKVYNDNIIEMLSLADYDGQHYI